MTKKSRRAKKRSRSPRLSATQLARPSTEKQGAGQPKPVAARQAAAATQPSLAEEYHYVIADLKRIGIIAAVMLVVMIVAAVVLI